MSYLLDTCVVSEPTKPRPSAAVLAWLRSVDPDALHVSVITIGELERGIERLPDGARRRALRGWLEQLRGEATSRLLPVTDAVATEWGRLMAAAERRGAVLPVMDALIGATAIVHGLTVVTRNTSDIGRTGAAMLDPWHGA
ncbi:MAG: type II toxin-antitoxin system VapC family toxin [Deltaproteobacteria bacterium]|nr:type II toxin-antitoxin system VapC family toxin [Deltaproteobacteria bacterium]